MSSCASSCYCIALGRFVLYHFQKDKNSIISDRNEQLELLETLILLLMPQMIQDLSSYFFSNFR